MQILLFAQIFVSKTIERMIRHLDIWKNGFWLGLTDMYEEGTWMWINNVTEAESRWVLQIYSVDFLFSKFNCWLL